MLQSASAGEDNTRLAAAETESMRTLRSAGKPEVNDFLAAHHQLLRDFMDGALRGRTDLDDALQHGLLRIVRDYDRWPVDQTPEQRLAYARKTLQWAAADVLRQQYGRRDRAPRARELPISLAEYDESPDSEQVSRDALRGLIRRRLSDLATVAVDDDGRLDRELYVGALAALDPFEHEVVTEHARGFEHKELAERLGESEQKIRATYSEARKLLLTLLGCARGHDVREAESFDLFGYLEGTLTDKRHRRLVKRHLHNCDNCQAIAALRTDADALSARLVLPLPMVVAVLGKSAPIAGLVASGASTATGGAGASSSGLLAGAGVKLAAGLATAALVGGGAVAATTPRDERRPPAAAEAASRAVPAPATPRVSSAKRERKRRPTRKRAPRRTPTVSPGLAPTTASTAPRPRAAATAPPQAAPSTPSETGGEFVLGGG